MKRGNTVWCPGDLSNRNPLVETTWDVWDDKEDIDIESVIFNSLYAMNEDAYSTLGFNNKDSRLFTLRDCAFTKLLGCYFPPAGRVFYTDTFDIMSDGVPDVMTLSGPKKWFNWRMGRGTPDLSTIAVYPVKHVPKNVRIPGGCDRFYKLVIWDFYEEGLPPYNIGQFYMDGMADTNIATSSTFIGVNLKKEVVVPCFDSRNYSPFSLRRRFAKEVFCMAASAYADRRNLWNVCVSMPITAGVSCPVVFGVHQEHIQSLLYAREEPLTKSGRKRPIQHWVSSHQRRIKKGVDVDVKKHLRGVSDFIMYGQRFQIISPYKKDNTALAEYENRAAPFLYKESPRFDKCDMYI